MTHTDPPSNDPNASQTASQKKEQPTEYITFTDKSIKHLKPTSKRRIVWARGIRGLGIRISTKGTKSFVYQYKHEGQDRFITFGKYPKLTLAEALEKYANSHKKSEAGEDPAEESVEKNILDRNSLTLKKLKTEYIEKYAKPRKRSWKEDERILDLFVEELGPNKKANKVKKREIIAYLDDIVAQGSPTMANRALSAIRVMFNFAFDRVLLDVSPCYRVKPPSPTITKDRHLSFSEIRQFWNNIDTAPLDTKTKQALKLRLLTLQRTKEILGIHISELDLDNNVWVIPKERTKNKKAHLVPISPIAKTILIELTNKVGKDGLLFSSSHREGYSESSVLSKAIKRNLDHFSIAKFTPHDLRRTGSTHLAAFKVPRFDRERLLNHTDNTVGSVYDLYEYQDEKCAILNLWNDIIKHVVSSKKKIDINELKKTFKYSDYFDN